MHQATRSRLLRPLIGVSAALLLPFALCACNTAEGVEEDLEEAGEEVEEAFDDLDD